jgi:hypothetical protein
MVRQGTLATIRRALRKVKLSGGKDRMRSGGHGHNAPGSDPPAKQNERPIF